MIVVMLASLVVLVGCKKGSSSAPAPAFTSLGASTAALRDAFDRDVGRARVLMLVSPT